MNNYLIPEIEHIEKISGIRLTMVRMTLKERLNEIERLNNIIDELDDEIYSLYEDICNSDDTYSYRIPIEIIIDRLVKMTSKIAKFKENEELKDSDNNVKKINTNNN